MRAGVTLLELMVVLTLLSILAGVVTLSMRPTPHTSSAEKTVARVLAARDSALRFGRSVTVVVSVSGSESAVTAIPDGRVVADPGLGFDLLSGHPSHASR